MPTICLSVALPLPLPEPFDYLPPAGEPATADWVGCRVRVRLGPRQLVGFVLAVAPSTLPPARLRPVEARIDAAPLLPAELWTNLLWLANYYRASPGEVLNLALPAPLRQGESPSRATRRAWSRCGMAPPRLRPGSPASQLWQLLADGPCDEDRLQATLPGWRAAARRLLAAGCLQVQALGPEAPLTGAGPALNAEQATAAAAIAAAPGFRVSLLEGVTGSGKTEVYLDALQRCLQDGRQALVLVPEIALTPQTVRRFRQRLGAAVHVMHSGLGDAARARAWASMAAGEPAVLVGTRSAVFTPLPRPGLIVIDEEHDASYKQQDGVRYSARDFAIVRARSLDVPIVLGSATPSLESLLQARRGRFQHLQLRQRAGPARPPRVDVIDLRAQRLQHGLALESRHALGETLAAGGQALVFRNRRGYAPVLLCHDCGWSAQCERCERPMTVHRGGRRLECHHCGAQRPAPSACPDCGGLGLQPQGLGTERLEQSLAELFPAVPVVRIDRDSTRSKDALETLLGRLGEQPGILVGTQMLAKGHDLPKLDLVVVIGVDEGLFSADFRSSERLAQLLVQVAGRAGRGSRPGRVLLQTHHPRHALLETLLHGGYPAFAEIALAEREALGFPPYAHQALLRAEAQDAADWRGFLDEARQAAQDAARGLGIELLGPNPAPQPRRAGYSRGQLLLSAGQRSPLHALLGPWWRQLFELPSARRVRWSLDVDPLDLY